MGGHRACLVLKLSENCILRKYHEDWNAHLCHLLLGMARVLVSSTRLRSVNEMGPLSEEVLLNFSCISMRLSSRDAVACAETLEPKVASRWGIDKEQAYATVNTCTCMKSISGCIYIHFNQHRASEKKYTQLSYDVASTSVITSSIKKRHSTIGLNMQITWIRYALTSIKTSRFIMANCWRFEMNIAN